MTMATFAITLYGQYCCRHVVGQPVVSDISIACILNLIIRVLIC